MGKWLLPFHTASKTLPVLLGMCSAPWVRDCDMAGDQSPPCWVWGRDGLLVSGEGEGGGVGCPGGPDPLLDPCGLLLGDRMAAGLAEPAPEWSRLGTAQEPDRALPDPEQPTAAGA